MLPTLKVVHGNNAGREYRLSEEEVFVGRGRECRVVVDDTRASRRHARLVRLDDVYWIEDLQSTNRTYVNGAVVKSIRRLNDRDRIRVGDTQFVFSSKGATLVESQESDSSVVLASQDVSPETETMLQVNAQEKLRAILQISQAMGRTLDLDVLLDTMLDGLFDVFPHASRALVLLRERDRLIPRAVKHRDDEEGSVQYSKTIVTRVMDRRQAILSQDAAQDRRFASTESVVNLQIRSVMCVPLLSHDSRTADGQSAPEALGVIQLETQDNTAHFKAADVQILVSVAVQVSVFLEYARLHDEILRQSRLQRELELAEQVQRDFLPQSTPEVEAYQFWTYYLAAGKVGGDFYDFLTLPNGNQVVLLGDVSGKGVPAALRMAKASTMCKVALLRHPDDLGQAAGAVNREIYDAEARGGFVTLVLSVINPQTHELTLANAGHLSPLRRSSDGTTDELTGRSQSGLPLGIVEDQAYPTSTVTMNPGDVVVLYSDGISEAVNPNGDLYTAQKVRAVVAAEKGRSPEETGRALIGDVRRHVGQREQTDDISLVVFGRSAAGGD